MDCQHRASQDSTNEQTALTFLRRSGSRLRRTLRCSWSQSSSAGSIHTLKTKERRKTRVRPELATRRQPEKRDGQHWVPSGGREGREGSVSMSRQRGGCVRDGSHCVPAKAKPWSKHVLAHTSVAERSEGERSDGQSRPATTTPVGRTHSSSRTWTTLRAARVPGLSPGSIRGRCRPSLCLWWTSAGRRSAGSFRRTLCCCRRRTSSSSRTQTRSLLRSSCRSSLRDREEQISTAHVRWRRLGHERTLVTVCETNETEAGQLSQGYE